MARTIVFGDVHACDREWNDLLDKLAVSPDDRLISVGDIICKGPSTSRALDLALSLKNFSAVTGNHELRFLKEWRAGRIPDIKSYDREAARDMGDRFDEYMKYIDSWSFYLETAEILVVHAGLRPGVKLKEQTEEDLTEIRRVGLDEKPWYEFYRGEKPAVFGHWVRREPLISDYAVGLDTGCVYGGKLSAYVLPARKVVSISARKVYQERKKPWD